MHLWTNDLLMKACCYPSPKRLNSSLGMSDFSPPQRLALKLPGDEVVRFSHVRNGGILSERTALALLSLGHRAWRASDGVLDPGEGVGGDGASG
jgi:hypothetical protein